MEWLLSPHAEAQLPITITLHFSPLLCGLLLSHILTHSTVTILWAMSNTLIFQNINVNIWISSSSSLAEELYQKVKRLFGDPHQATEDLKAEVIITSNLSSFCFNVPKLMTLTKCVPICFPRLKRSFQTMSRSSRRPRIYSTLPRERPGRLAHWLNKIKLTLQPWRYKCM